MQKVKIPWAAWHEETNLELTFPDEWDIHTCHMKDAPRISDQDILKNIQNPIGSRPLRELAIGRKNAVIAVEDITRPAKLKRIIKCIINELLCGGIEKSAITFLICNGAHAPMLRIDMVKKFGQEIVSDFLIINHNPYDNLADTNITLGKTPLQVNRFFVEADLKIGVGTIMPHSFAGFSSGGKLVLPGLSDIGSLERSHKFVMMGFRGGVNDVETNKFRLELEDVARQIGMDFFIGILPNSRREISAVYTGDLVAAHRNGVEFGRSIYRTSIVPSDLVILNAYPKDTELIQADTALTPLKTTKHQIIKDGGMAVITTNSSNGLGYHSLFGPGMRLYRPPTKRRFLNDSDLMVLSPNVNLPEFKTVFWHQYQLSNNWGELLEKLKKRLPQNTKVSILPTAPLQLLECNECTT
ncbi:lactate racemase domain-containing protein [Thermodesulfobacteriota bacterium]